MKSSQHIVLKFLGAASVTLPLFVALAGCGKIKGALQSPPAPTPATVRLSDFQQGLLYQQQGVIAKQDYLHLVKIQGGIDKTQKLSDEDVAFIVHELNILPFQNTSKNAAKAQDLVLAHTYASPGHKPKHLTPAQCNILYNAMLPYTNSRDEGVQVNSTLALAGTRDPRAIKVLNNLAQNSPRPLVRMDAAVFLKQLRKVLASPGKSGG